MLTINPPPPPTSLLIFLFSFLPLLSLFKKNLKISGGGVEPPLKYALASPLCTPLYIVNKIKYHATAVCKLRCIEVIFVIK